MNAATRAFGIITVVDHDLADALAFGPDQPQRFLTTWFGPPQRASGDPETGRGALATLRGWHQQVARWSAPVLSQNSVPTDGQRDSGRLLVGVENQAVWLWAVEDGGDNPAVLERENTSGSPWVATGEHLDEYLWHFVLFEAVLGAQHALATNNATEEAMRRFVEDWRPVPVKPWQWPGPEHALWFRDGSLALTCANEPPGTAVKPESMYAVFLGSRDRASLARIDRLDLDWGYDSAGTD